MSQKQSLLLLCSTPISLPSKERSWEVEQREKNTPKYTSTSSKLIKVYIESSGKSWIYCSYSRNLNQALKELNFPQFEDRKHVSDEIQHKSIRAASHVPNEPENEPNASAAQRQHWISIHSLETSYSHCSFWWKRTQNSL